MVKKKVSLQQAPDLLDPLSLFHPVTAGWFRAVFPEPTAPQKQGWPAIAKGDSTLIFAPTGTGKTLTAFLWCLDKLMLQNVEEAEPGTRVLYISPLKALAVDVERNLRSPLAGIANMARRLNVPFHEPSILVRTGDTPQAERNRYRKHPAEIVITTPESLYLMLTSNSAEQLSTIETVILDEIHALVPTKRGAHLALSLERLQALTQKPIQRIGLSATQRPLDEVARFLGGAFSSPWKGDELSTPRASSESDPEIEPNVEYRPVTIVNAQAHKELNLSIEVPVEDMARLGDVEELPSGPAAQGPKRATIWTAIHEQLLKLILERSSTLIFVNSRRIAERLAGAINELANETLARAHHGSLAADQRAEIEDLLKAGKLRALVATSSLELGIDMGAIDLVIQIEAPPSVASGMQRIGRAGHKVGVASNGVIFPKYRGDLVACAAVTRAMHEQQVESTRYLRNPLDVLAQQIVAIVAQPPGTDNQGAGAKSGSQSDSSTPGILVDDLAKLIRGCAAFANISRSMLEGVLDMLAGLYPSDEFAELRPRITWDRVTGYLTPREGSKRLAIMNAGTIPDRGLYGVFLAGTEGKPVRVGELDEEMVFETHMGETFILGASTWRIEEITHDRVLVSPAPGEPGKMPFWHGDRPGRPLEFGKRIGALVRELRDQPHNTALSKLVHEHDLKETAAENLLQYLSDQAAATEVVPNDRTVVIERLRDELGDWRVCVLTPFGTRIHAPWAMAVSERLRSTNIMVETMWTDDGFVVRFPESDKPPDISWIMVDPRETNELVLSQLGSTALFAAKFREAASRALLLPRRRATGRAPLWQQRKRAYDLLNVASRYSSFPILLEVYRECLRDVFDMPSLLQILREMESLEIRTHIVDTKIASPFAASLLFGYVANYIYDGDAPLAERRAQALSIDQEQLRELLGDADLREILDGIAIVETEEQLQLLVEDYRARSVDGVHDMLLRLGDLSRIEIAARTVGLNAEDVCDLLLSKRRALEIQIQGGKRMIAIEDAARYRDAIGAPLPPGIPRAFLTETNDADLDLLRRYARTHGPFITRQVAHRFGLDEKQVESRFKLMTKEGKLLEGGFRPDTTGHEWCDAEVLRIIRRKSLAKMRREIEPASQLTLARLYLQWQGVAVKRRGLDALLDAIEQLQGVAIPASALEREILPARIRGYSQRDLDTLIAAGEVIWTGIEPLGERDGRIALYLADQFSLLKEEQAPYIAENEKQKLLLKELKEKGASFFSQLHDAAGGGYPGETLDALWALVWKGLVTNDTFHVIRAYTAKPGTARPTRKQHNLPTFRSRRTVPPTAQGRWVMTNSQPTDQATGRKLALAQQLLKRHGVLTREAVHAEYLAGGFSSVYDVLKAMEESGKLRRGYFVEGLGATQFAQQAAVETLRSLRSRSIESGEVVTLAATDPANVYGNILPWPVVEEQDSKSVSIRAFTRSTGASVVLINGLLVAYMRRNNPSIQVLLPANEPDRSIVSKRLAQHMVSHQAEASGAMEAEPAGLLITQINGIPVHTHPLAPFLLEAGFQPAPNGFNLRRNRIPAGATRPNGSPVQNDFVDVNLSTNSDED